MELPPEWANKSFDDADVIKAYSNFLLDLIGRFEPDYVCFGAEVNGGFAENDPQLGAFEKFVKAVRNNVRAEHPNVPLFLSFVVAGSGAEGTRQMNLTRKFLKYSDYVAVSTYPFIEAAGGAHGDADPDNLPRNWFTRMHDLAPEKPFAVAETGYIAEDLVLQTYGINIKGTKEWQEEYVRFLFQECNKLDAEFVVYFLVRDYDQGWERLRQQGHGEFYKMWRDCGLIDGNGEARPSLGVWDTWFGASRTAAFGGF
jgi:arabinogalactan endo-1,4-beta-galactosidase